MESGTELPKIRVGGKLTSFNGLKEQGILNEGLAPSCTESGEVFPDFTETATLEANVPHFSQDDVFIHELMYYRPEDYCVDGELDTYDYQEEEEFEKDEEGGEQLSYIKVMLCEERVASMGRCEDKTKSCYPR
jgi:hypothetical protein